MSASWCCKSIILRCALRATVCQSQMQMCSNFVQAKLSRAYHHSCQEIKKDVKNIEIPVPWGVVAGQRWGEGKKLLLCIHGWKDNSATFDRLLPLVQPFLQDYTILAIDLPGHGMSSHFPAGMIYQVVDILVLITRIRKHFGWEKISLIGHSFGAIVSFLYTGTHPHVVEKMVGIDALTPIVFNKSDMLAVVPKLIHDTLHFEKKLKTRKVPTYTYEEALDKVMYGNVGALDEVSCKMLMSRGMVEEPAGSGQFRFTHDIRVHYLPVMTLSSKQVSYVAKNFASDLLHIKAHPGVSYERPYIVARIKSWLTEEAEHKHNEVRFEEVEGNHHVHLTNPELVAPKVLDFLKPKVSL